MWSLVGKLKSSQKSWISPKTDYQGTKKTKREIRKISKKKNFTTEIKKMITKTKEEGEDKKDSLQDIRKDSVIKTEGIPAEKDKKTKGGVLEGEEGDEVPDVAKIHIKINKTKESLTRKVRTVTPKDLSKMIEILAQVDMTLNTKEIGKEFPMIGKNNPEEIIDRAGIAKRGERVLVETEGIPKKTTPERDLRIKKEHTENLNAMQKIIL